MTSEETEPKLPLFLRIVNRKPTVTLEEICEYLADEKNGYYYATENKFHSIRWELPLEYHQAILVNKLENAIKAFMTREENLFPPHGNFEISYHRPQLTWYYTGDLYYAWCKGDKDYKNQGVLNRYKMSS